ncbi:hypothetical protein GCM10009650_02080 [Nesterenkonia jeotgali]
MIIQRWDFGEALRLRAPYRDSSSVEDSASVVLDSVIRTILGAYAEFTSHPPADVLDGCLHPFLG